MRRRQRNYSWIAIIFIGLAIITILIAYFYFEPESNLPLKISYSLDPSTVKVNNPAKLNFSITNVNETFHEVQFIFNTDSRLEIYAGTDELLTNNIYNFTIGFYEADQVREFIIIGSLEENIARARYQIQLQVSLDKQIVPELTKNIYLTVTED